MMFRAFLLASVVALAAASAALAQSPNVTEGRVTATGATATRTLAAIEADVINVKYGWSGVAGAKGDTVGVSGCSIAAGSTLLTCGSAAFTAADTGKRYYLQGTGTANVPQTGTITYVSGTTVTLSNAAVVAAPQGGIYSPPAAPVTIASAGSGYTDGTQTLTITGGACTVQPQVSVTVAGNVVTAVLGMVDPGVCSVVPSSAAATTGGGGTGATFTTSGFSVAGRFLYGTDDTAAITAAFAKAVATGKKLVIPAGGYWLATASAAIPLNNIAVEGDGAVGFGWPFVQKGTWLLISNQSTAGFSGMSGVDWSGVNVYYPEQDGSAAEPVAFPALFTSTQWANTTIRNSRFANPRDMAEITVGAGSGLGRVTFDVRAYCVRRCLSYANGQADVLTIGPTNYFGPGAFDNEAPYGPAHLGRYTATNGTWLYADTTSGAYDHLDGLMLTGFIVQGMRYGIRAAGNTIVSVSNVSNVNWDGVLTPISVEGTAQWISSSVTGGTVYSINIYDATASGSPYSTTSTGQVDFSISGGNIQYAMGHVFYDNAAGPRRTNISGMTIGNWGRTTTAGTYYARAMLAGGATKSEVFSGNRFNCANSGSIVKSGVLVTADSGYRGVYSGNIFTNCWDEFVTQGAAGTISITGNLGRDTGSRSLRDISASDFLLFASGNVFPGTMLIRAPTISSCGTSPSASSASSNQSGDITIGSGVVTACTLTFTSALPRVPKCSGGTNVAAITASVTAVSATAVTFEFPATMAGNILRYQCSL